MTPISITTHDHCHEEGIGIKPFILLGLLVALALVAFGFQIGQICYQKPDPRSWMGTVLSVDQLQDEYVRYGGKDPVIVVRLDSPGIGHGGVLFNRIKEVSVPKRTFSLLKVGDHVAWWKVDGDKIEFEGVVPK